MITSFLAGSPARAVSIWSQALVSDLAAASSRALDLRWTAQAGRSSTTNTRLSASRYAATAARDGAPSPAMSSERLVAAAVVAMLRLSDASIPSTASGRCVVRPRRGMSARATSCMPRPRDFKPGSPSERPGAW